MTTKMTGKSTLNALAIVAVTGAMLSSCSSFQPDYTDCSHLLTAPQEGVRAGLVSEAGIAGVEARLNGVSAQCYQKGEQVIAEVSVGLKLTRDISVSADADRVEIPFLIARLDQNDTAIGYDSFGFLLGWAKNRAQQYPVVDFDVIIPQGGRAILALTPENVSID